MRLPLSAYSAHSVQETGIILGYSPRARSIRLVLRVCPAGGFRARTGVQRAEAPFPRGQAGGVARLRFPARYYATGVGRAWRAGEPRAGYIRFSSRAQRLHTAARDDSITKVMRRPLSTTRAAVFRKSWRKRSRLGAAGSPRPRGAEAAYSRFAAIRLSSRRTSLAAKLSDSV